MADYQLSYTGDQVNTAIGQIINKNITGTLTIETLDLTNSLAITQGGTGATTAAAARENLGIKSCGTYDILPIAKGGTGKTTATEALKALCGISLTKLWENASPTSAFKNQTLTLDLSSYDLVIILFNLDSNGRSTSPAIVPIGHPGVSSYGNNARNFLVHTNDINFDSVSPSSAVMIPYVIYGVKGVI